MKAITQDRYGSPDVLELSDVPDRVPTEDQVLVEVRAVSLNPYDWHLMRGTPYFVRAQNGLRRPKVEIPGMNYAGVVEAVGANVEGFSVGDRVFGEVVRSLAEHLVTSDKGITHMPDGVDFEDAAAVPMAGETALQGLRDHGELTEGQRVLINGASGGVGTYAVQIAAALGAEVTGVCSSRNLNLVRSIGAHHVIDYTKDNFTELDVDYDLILDMVGTQPWDDVRRVLARDGKVIVGGWLEMGAWLGPLGSMLGLRRADRKGSQTFKTFLANRSVEDMATIARWMEEGKVRSVIDRTLPLADTAEAMRHLETMHAAGKVVVTI